jgi:Lon protease-like protein
MKLDNTTEGKMETKDDVLRKLLEPIVEQLVSNAMNTYLAVNGLDDIVERAIRRMDSSRVAQQMQQMTSQQQMAQQQMAQAQAKVQAYQQLGAVQQGTAPVGAGTKWPNFFGNT